MTNINIQILPEEKKVLISMKGTQQEEYFFEEKSDLFCALDAFICKYPII